MEKLLNTINTILGKADMSSRDIGKVQKIVEILYFQYIKKWYKFPRFSEEYKVAKDLQNLHRRLSKVPATIKGISPKSQLIKDKLSELGDVKSKANLEKHEVNLIRAEIIEKHDYYMKAVFITDIIYHEYKKDRRRWVWGIVFGFISGFLIKNFDWVKEIIMKSE